MLFQNLISRAFGIFTSILIFAFNGHLHAGTELTYYVSPTGNDSNNGTSPLSPFATLAKARDIVRNSTSNMTGDIVVNIGKGDYSVLDTIEFTGQDSGSNGFNVIYKCADSIGAARFIGGTKVQGWSLYKDHIFRANIGTGLGFTTLYENGIRADMARWPKRTSPFATSRAGYLTEVDDHSGTVTFQDNSDRADGLDVHLDQINLDHAWIYNWDGGDGHRWSSANRPMKLKTPISGNLIPSENGGYGIPYSSFLIEGSLDLLSRPGEFYYDSDEGWLYYYSRFWGDIKSQEIIVPKLVRLISLQGKSPENPVENIRFQGLTFLGTDRLPNGGTADWSDSQQASWDATVFARNAADVNFKNCRIADAGICGITFESSTKHCSIEGCLVEHTGFHGISLINGEDHLVENSLIRYVGELRGHGDGVSIMMDPGRPDGKSTDEKFCSHTLRHLDIYYSARAGVAIRGLNDVIQYVKVHDCVQDSGDQGAFYMVAPAVGTSVDQCTSFHNYCDLSNMDRPPTAVYNDRDATNTKWSNIDAGDSQMFIFRHDPQKTGNLYFDNVSWDPKCNPRNNEVAKPLNLSFDKSKMQYDQIGITADFPKEYNDSSLAPAAPLNLWTEPGRNQVTLHWTETDRATSYNIRRYNPSAGGYAIIGNVIVPKAGWDLGTHFTDTGLMNSQTYSYVVTAVNKAGESPASLDIRVRPNEEGTEKLTGTPIGTGDPSRAFDGDLTTYFESQNGWAGLDLGQNFVITKIQYSPRSDNTDTTSRMCGGLFQGASDPAFTNPVTLYQVLATKGGAGTPVLIPQTVSDTTPVRYVRYIGPSGKTLVGEIEFYGSPAH